MDRKAKKKVRNAIAAVKNIAAKAAKEALAFGGTRDPGGTRERFLAIVSDSVITKLPVYKGSMGEKCGREIGRCFLLFWHLLVNSCFYIDFDLFHVVN